MKNIILIISFLTIHQFAQSQNNEVLLENRDKSIQFNNEAIINIYEGKSNKAIYFLSKAIVTDSTYRESYLNTFQVWKNDNSRSETVMQFLKKGISVFPNDDELHYYIAEIYYSSSKFKNAIYYYSKAIELSRNNGEDFFLVPFYYQNRGNSYLKSKNYAKAIQDYKKLISLDPESTLAYNNIGIAYYQLKNKAKACEYWGKASKMDFDLSIKYFNKFCKK